MLSAYLRGTADFISGHGSAWILIAAIACGSVIGLTVPGVGNVLSGHLDAFILLLVFLLLFEVQIKNIVKSLGRLPFIIVALIANFIIIPVVGYSVATFFLIDYPLMMVGLVIYFMAPCTDWFLGFTRLAKGNTALGAALLPVNLLVQLMLFPVYVWLFGINVVESGTIQIFETLVQWFFIPLLLAVALRTLADRLLREDQLDILQSVISTLVPLVLSIVVWQISAINIGTLTANLAVVPLVVGAVFVFFTLTFLLSELISRVMKLGYGDQVLLTMTTAARNAPLMLALAIAVMPDQPVIYSAIIIGMLIEIPHLIVLKSLMLRRRIRSETDAKHAI